MRIVLGLCVIAAAGCATDSGGGVSGQLPGGDFETADSISASVIASSDGTDPSSSAQILLASTGNLCSDASASPPVDHKGQRFVTIDLRDVNGATRTTPTAPGVYTIYPDTGSEPPKSASLRVGGFDNTCQLNDDLAAQAQSGTVTLSAIAGGKFSGSFDVTLNTGDHLTGTFDPEPCPALAAAVSDGDPHTCQ